jgi:glutathione S-transferase
MAQYVLHYAPDNASLVIRLVLEELGLSYDSRPVDRSTRAQDSAAFKALNPLRRMPALSPTPFSNPQPPNPPEGSAV